MADQLLVDPHEVAFLGLAAEGPSWLTVENGKVSLAPTEETKFLLVIIETGPI